MQALAGKPYPLGASVHPDGINFAVQAPRAQQVWLCLLGAGTDAEHNIELTHTHGVWHGFIPGLKVGQRYGYRAGGPWDPQQGYRYNKHKLLLDPYASGITGELTSLDSALAYLGDDPFGAPNDIDSEPSVPHSYVSDPSIIASTSQLDIPWKNTIIYEAHLGSLSAKHPEVPPELRGTYLGACQPAIVEHLVSLGVTAIEFLPLHACITEPNLIRRGYTNHWGYSPGSFFAPDPRFSSRGGAEHQELATMVDVFHDAGIEVIVDVVYNHSCEIEETGPHLSWRGLDALEYYHIDPEGRYWNYTGTGNTFDAGSPITTAMIVDSLRYWVNTFKIDGFRFDLASVLGRGSPVPSVHDGAGFTNRSPALTAIVADPLLQTRKLIAEPWDATGEGYQVGNFLPPWRQWNDRFRDTSRSFWLGGGASSELATRLCGSEDVFAVHNEVYHHSPLLSVNFITAHDGFTLEDLVSYDVKHNEDNGEHNRDGTDNNISHNHGVEGATNNPEVRTKRIISKRNLLATLLLSRGVPMLVMGDELGHSQSGNNNAYCVPVGTPAGDAYALDWAAADNDLIAYTRSLIQLRRDLQICEVQDFFSADEVLWFDPTGKQLAPEDWKNYPQSVQMLIPKTALFIFSAIATEISLPTPAQGWKIIHNSSCVDAISADNTLILPYPAVIVAAP